MLANILNRTWHRHQPFASVLQRPGSHCAIVFLQALCKGSGISSRVGKKGSVPAPPTVLALCIPPAQAHRARLVMSELPLPTHAAHPPAESAPARARNSEQRRAKQCTRHEGEEGPAPRYTKAAARAAVAHVGHDSPPDSSQQRAHYCEQHDELHAHTPACSACVLQCTAVWQAERGAPR